jgi:hypothetical protein
VLPSWVARLDRLVSVRLLLTLLAASAMGSRARRTLSAVAATALLRVHQMAAPAPQTVSAVVTTARAAFVVRLVGSDSATAPARCLALPMSNALRLAVTLSPPNVNPSLVAEGQRIAGVLGPWLSVAALPTVLPGSFV